MNINRLQSRINKDALNYFHRACIRELADIDMEETTESPAKIFEEYVASRLAEKTQSLGCKDFKDIVVSVEKSSVDYTLSEITRPFLEDCQDQGFPRTSAEMKSLNMIGFLIYPGEIGFVDGISLDLQMWNVSGEELDFMGNPENLIVSFQPMLTFDLYGNLMGYTSEGVVNIFEGGGADWEFDWGI